MLTRKTFIRKSLLAAASLHALPKNVFANKKDAMVMTVNGLMLSNKMQFTLTHEHVLCDFTGAEKYSAANHNADGVYARALPFLQDVKSKGCVTFIDCTPAYIGRDVQLLQRLSQTTGLNIITNTGFYGAAGEKYFPSFVYTETANEIANRWINEWQHGIERTNIKPGFIKSGVDKAPLSAAQQKIIEAAAITHLATGLTIAVHTGDGEAAKEQLRILATKGVSPAARIWVHAQNETGKAYHIEAARNKSWVSFDGVNKENIATYLQFLQNMKAEQLLDNVLVSQDSGWYTVGEPNGGNYKDYNSIFTHFIPALKENGFTAAEIEKIFVTNPAKAFAVGVRKL